MFDRISHFDYITALPSCFLLFALHSTSNFSFWPGVDFPLVSSPFLPFLPAEAKQRENCELVEAPTLWSQGCTDT
jgi:hypothetical protein